MEPLGSETLTMSRRLIDFVCMPMNRRQRPSDAASVMRLPAARSSMIRLWR